MSLFRSFSEIVNSMIESLKLTQPNLDTKVGTVARDLFIDPHSAEIEKLHRAVLLVSDKQSPDSAVGQDLDKWASNYKIQRNSASPSSGIVVFTTNEITNDIPIPSGTLCTARNGYTYRTIGSYVFSVSEKNRWAANGSRLRKGLNLAGISDKYAIEVPVQATRGGRSGNIAPLQITASAVEDSLRVTNLVTFRDGENSETDSAFKSRIFATFSGANIGTSAGYKNAALSVPGVLDALIVEPGNALLLRDGTETIQLDSGNFRILNSGTGGKVDIYILGSKVEEYVESYLYIDKSGNADPTDERNDYIPGVGALDKTLTPNERRISAFKNGLIPLQPINGIVTVIGSSSGILPIKSTDENGVVSGNVELIKDESPEVGGSPFGYDKIRFVSKTKNVEAEPVLKQSLNSIDPLKFRSISEVSNVYFDTLVLKEFSSVSISDKTQITLKHKPVVNTSRVLNKTTGEVYSIANQNIDPDTGLNEEGIITISGKALPNTSDILSVDYIWRHVYDPYIDYNGMIAPASYYRTAEDSINWSPSNIITSEESTITKSEDDIEFQISTDYPVTSVLSVYSATEVPAVVSLLTSGTETYLGIELDSSYDEVSNVASIKSTVELYNTKASDGSFSGRVIYLPSDSSAQVDDIVTVRYNKNGFFDIANSNGIASSNLITLPSDDILTGADVYDLVDDAYLTNQTVYIDYISSIEKIVNSVSLSQLPISGAKTNSLFNSSLTELSTSNQPVFYNYASGVESSIARFGPARITVQISGSTTSGKVKIAGTSLTRLTGSIESSLLKNGIEFDFTNIIKSYFGLSTLPSSISIARVDLLETESDPFDLNGVSLNSNLYDLNYSYSNSDLSRTKFEISRSENNISIDPSSAEKISYSILVSNSADAEELYFQQDGSATTEKVFARIDRISVVSGFRNSSNSLIGNLSALPANSPPSNSSYNVDYSFAAPKEGERITVRYTVNKLIIDTTQGIERVRPITADVLVKEAFLLPVDIYGQILISDNFKNNQNQVLENVTNAVVNLVNSSALGSTLDYSDIIVAASSASGVDSVNISLFNKSGEIGRKTFIRALDNQSISAGTIKFTSVSRKDFRIT